MKKIEIVTIISQNYGNRLQNYALQETLRKAGFDVSTNRYKEKSIKEKIFALLFELRGKKRHDLFIRFDREISWADKKYIRKENPGVDYYIAGSDQIWNPEFEFNSGREFLDFVVPEKRIAYAGSIGIGEISQNLKEKYSAFFKAFKSLSVREERGKAIIYELTGRDVPVLVDPVFLLEDKEWSVIAKKSKVQEKRPFVLKYFLGLQNEEVNRQIEEMASKYHLEIIDISPLTANVYAGPREFVDFISKATLVCTDSFHAVAFSIIFKKNFLCMDRIDAVSNGNGMQSRMETLQQKFAIKDGWVKCRDDFPEDIIQIDYSHVEERLLKERNYALDFLKDALR